MAKFNPGDVVGIKVIDGGKRDWVVIREQPDGYTVLTPVDKPWKMIEKVYHGLGLISKGRTMTVPNSRAANAKFEVGDTVKLSKSHPRNPGKKGKIVQVFPTGFVKVELADGSTDIELEKNVAANARSRACNSTNPIVRKAINAEDAQGHEHGSDGRFTSKGGGESKSTRFGTKGYKKDAEDFHSRIDSMLAKAESGGDSYEDPKTKRMRERLAKMREKTEALRKENEQRRAALAGKKAELEKMRADIMKANVDRWKAGLSASKNAIVAKAMNACAANTRLRPGDRVRMEWNPDRNQRVEGRACGISGS